MSRIDTLNLRYEASAEIVRHGVELVVVGDQAGAKLNAAVRTLLTVIRDEGPGLWDDLASASKAVRWRLATQPQPREANPSLREGAHGVMVQTARLRGRVTDDGARLLDALQAATEAILDADPVAGPVLLRCINEVGRTNCVVVAASPAASAGLGGWLGGLGIQVRTAGELQREGLNSEQAYVVGPPSLFPPAVVTAPTTEAVSFILPSWYGDRSIPRSAIAPYADGAVAIRGRVFSEGDSVEDSAAPVNEEIEDELVPQPVWGSGPNASREPATDEVLAHRVLLSGDLAIMLDDGERIRTLDPSQPVGERVTYTEVPAVRRGTYLLLRKGETERRALYASALSRMGARSTDAAASQLGWKRLLQHRLSEQGHAAVRHALDVRGLRTLDRIRAWTDPTLVRPQNPRDFELLLEWLGLPVQPSFELATTLSRLRHKASAEIREQLEDAVAGADMSALQRDGHLQLDLDSEGFRGIVATRVLAISPHAEIVARHEARIPFEDRSGQWLE